MPFGHGKNDGVEGALLCFGWVGGACNTLGDTLTVSKNGSVWATSADETTRGCLVDADGESFGCWTFPFEMTWWPKE